MNALHCLPKKILFKQPIYNFYQRNINTLISKNTLKILSNNYLDHVPKCCRYFTLQPVPSYLSTYTPVLFLQDALIKIHDMSGLPWWSVILISTVGLRSAVTLPLAVHQFQTMAKLENLRKEEAEYAPQLRKEVTDDAKIYNWNFSKTQGVYRRRMKKYHDEIVIRDNCHPAKLVILLFIQVPLWICFSAALRNLFFMMPEENSKALAIFSQLQSEGTLWFTDMTQTDPVFIPLMLASINLLIIQIYTLKRLTQMTFFQKIFQNFSRGLSLFIAAYASITPTCVSFYWLCSSSYGLIQNIGLLFPKVRRILKIPLTASETATPYKNIWNNLKSSFKKKR